MASQAQRGNRYGPREKLGAFSRIVRSVTFMSQEQKIAFDNSVKGDPREERNIPQRRETAFDEITKSAAQQGLAKLPNLPDQRWRKRKCQKKRKMMFNR